MTLDMEVKEIVDSLESLGPYIKHSTYKKLMAETLVHLFYQKTTNESKIRRAVNKVLVSEGLEEVSLNYIKLIIKAKKQKDMGELHEGVNND